MNFFFQEISCQQDPYTPGTDKDLFYTLVVEIFHAIVLTRQNESKEAQNPAFLYLSLDTETEHLTAPSKFAFVIPRNSKIYIKTTTLHILL